MTQSGWHFRRASFKKNITYLKHTVNQRLLVSGVFFHVCKHLFPCDITTSWHHIDINCKSIRFTVCRLSISENGPCRSHRCPADTNDVHFHWLKRFNNEWKQYELVHENIHFILLYWLATPPPMEGNLPSWRESLPNLILTTASLGNPRPVTFAILAPILNCTPLILM